MLCFEKTVLTQRPQALESYTPTGVRSRSSLSLKDRVECFDNEGSAYNTSGDG
jgi:hypothetical protein